MPGRPRPRSGAPADARTRRTTASSSGAPTHPDWYHNLVAHPDVTVEMGPDTVPMRARVAEPEERERIWSRQKEIMPGFADYEQKKVTVYRPDRGHSVLKGESELTGGEELPELDS